MRRAGGVLLLALAVGPRLLVPAAAEIRAPAAEVERAGIERAGIERTGIERTGIERAEIQAGPATPGRLRLVRRSDDDLLILELRLGSFVLGEAVEGYLNGGGLLLPLGDLARALDFPISVEPDSGRAEGWFLDEDRLFSLDLARREVIVNGRRTTFGSGLAEPHETDIFVDTRLLSRWFPIDMEFDLANLSVAIKSREPLPVELRLARDQKRARLVRSEEGRRKDLPTIDVPYKAIDWPFADTSIETGFRRDDRGKTVRETRYTSLVTGDLLFLNSRFFLAGTDRDPFTRGRLEMGRKDPDGGLLGPLKVSEIALGDVAGPQIALTSRSKFGRGFVISSFPLNQPSEFDRITIRGELPLGWEAELYRNEVLLDFQTARDDGRYEFLDVPLIFGLNVLRVELFGPQGQRRQDTRRILVGPGLVRPGEHNFRIAASQQDKDLLPIRDDTIENADDELEGKARVFAHFERGMTRTLSLAAGFSSLPFEDRRRHYGMFGIRAVTGSLFSRLDIVPDSSGGWAVNASLQTRIATNFSLSLEHGIFRKFVSEQVPDEGDFLRSRSKIRLDGVLALPLLPQIPVSLTGDLDRKESGRNEAQISNRISVPIRRLLISNNLQAQIARGGEIEDVTTLSGNVLIGGRFGAVNLRGQLAYDVVPMSLLTSTAVTGEWYINRNFAARLGVNRKLTKPAQTTYSVGVSRTFRNVSVGLNADYAEDGSLSARLNLSFGLGREPRVGDLRMRPHSIADKGAATVRVYLDRNTNGRFDDGDTPLEGVEFKANRGPTSEATNAAGVAFLSGLTPDRRVDLTLSLATLEDPYWIPTPKGVTFVPRPGVVGVADFPVIATAEIDGTVYQRFGVTPREVSNVSVQLLTPAGQMVRETRSAFDGFYLLDFVPPGRYLLRIDPDQMARLNMRAPPAREITLVGEEVINGEDFTIARGSELASRPSRPDAAPQRDDASKAPKSDVAERRDGGAAAEGRPQASPDPALPARLRATAPTTTAPPATAPTAPRIRQDRRYRVQLGAYRDPAIASLVWRRLKRDHARLLGASVHTIRRADLGPGRGIFHQLRTGAFAARGGAAELCAALSARRVDCFVVAMSEAVAGDGAPVSAVAQPAPSFDRLTVSLGGRPVMMGSAPPGWRVALFAKGRAVAWVTADAEGRWTWTPRSALLPGTYRMRALAFAPDGRVLVSGTDLVLMIPRPRAGAASGDAARSALALSLPRDGTGETKILRGPGRSGGLTISMIEYDTSGSFVIVGRALPEARVRVYLGQEHVGDVLSDADGDWRLALDRVSPPGRTRVRVEHVAGGGLVAERFTVDQDFGVTVAPALRPNVITVRRGNNLWRIARRVYGRGVLHTILYGVNRDRIDDSDRIRPGQKLDVPVLD